MSATLISIQSTEGLSAVAGQRWLHTVAVGSEIVKVAVRPSGLGYSFEIESASSEEVASAAMGLVAQAPRG